MSFHFYLIMLKKRQNKKYKFVTRDDFISELNQSSKSKDNNYQLKLLEHAVNYLDEFNIKTYEDIIGIFKNYGIASKEMIIIMNEFKKYMKEHKDKNDDSDKRFNIEWLNMRSFKILKFSGKNIILNRILFEYPDYFTIFLEKYFKENDAVCFNFCLNELQNKIKLIHDQSQKKFYSN